MPPRKAVPLEDLIAQLRLPPLEGAELSGCPTAVAALNEHLQQHSAATPEGIASITRTLTEVARLDTDPRRKHDLLALFMLRIIRFTATIGQSRLDDSASGLIATSINLLKQQSLGYKSVLAELTTQWPGCGPQLMSRAIAACQDALGLTYLRCLQLHLPAPGNLWTELNTLYRIAFQLNLQDMKVRMVDSAFSPELSLQERYMRILLLACAHPYQYENHELEQIYATLSLWSSLTTLAPAPDEGVFLIDIAGDEGPFLATRHHRITATMLRIRTSRLVRHLQDRLHSGSAPAIDRLPTPLVQRLCNTWGQEYSRNEDRVTIIGHMELTMGLANAHALLGATTPLRPPGDAGARWLDEVPDTAPTPVAGREINISKRGSCIELEPPAADCLAPGEVVAMRRTQSAPWCIAMVRWKRAKPDFSARFGLEVIARHALPCAVKATASDGSHYRPGLLLADEHEPHCWRLMTAPSQTGPEARVDIVTTLDCQQLDLGPAELATAGLTVHFLPGADFGVTDQEAWA